MASLQEILEAREQRWQRQQELLEHFKNPLILFSMNIPGPEKDSPLIRQTFALGDELIRGQLTAMGFSLAFSSQEVTAAGCYGIYVTEADPVQLKKLTVQIEESTPVGRLFDMDVLTAAGEKLSREELGLPERQCLLCHQPARLCGRSRVHSLPELLRQTEKLMRSALITRESQRIGALAARSLLYEVCTTPKPGLVDTAGRGSHADMDLFTSINSSTALQPYFTDCARIGMETATMIPAETFERLRFRGRSAEQAMYDATGGINTHKGAIFSLGLLCGAAGRLSGQERNTQQLLRLCSEMVRGITGRELTQQDTADTNGKRLYSLYGITGVRGQAEMGFPAVREHGLPVFRAGIAKGLSVNDAGCAALLHLMANTQDTNLIARSDLSTQQRIAEKIRSLLEKEPYPGVEALRELDREFTERNLSPGGSADLLAVTYFLHFLEQN